MGNLDWIVVVVEYEILSLFKADWLMSRTTSNIFSIFNKTSLILRPNKPKKRSKLNTGTPVPILLKPHTNSWRNSNPKSLMNLEAILTLNPIPSSGLVEKPRPKITKLKIPTACLVVDIALLILVSYIRIEKVVPLLVHRFIIWYVKISIIWKENYLLYN